MMYSVSILPFVLLSQFVFAFGNVPAFPTSFEEASLVLKDHVKSYHKPTFGKSLCETSSCCNVTSTESCPLSKFARDEPVLVLPGGSTRCIYSYSTPYAFQVIPGDSDKLLFYFQGGGACWDETSTRAGFCSTDVAPQEMVGVFDRANLKNTFRSYTVVEVLYCSGDVHGANSTRPYNDNEGQPIVQAGLVNTGATLDWVKEQMKNGLLASTFNELVIMGCSAGSIGAQLWSQEILKELPFKHAAIVPDSYVGIFPPGVLGPIIYDFGFCETGFLTPELYAKCINKTLEVVDIGLVFASENPHVPYAFIETKGDAIQTAVYIAMATTQGYHPAVITPAGFYHKVNEVFGAYNQAGPNFLTYLIDGNLHCFTQVDSFYDADTKGNDDKGKSTTTELLHDWVGHFPMEEGDVVNSRCDGLAKPVLPEDISYCSPKVYPKSFTEHW